MVDLQIVETLYESNCRDVPATLRKIAVEIEEGKFGDVSSAGLVLLGERMEVFGMGIDYEAPSIALLLHAGFMRLSKAIEEHGNHDL